MMLGYYTGSTWNLLYRVDKLSGFEKTIDLTETYCNATLWKDLTYAGYSFRLAIRYCLGVNDRNLTVIPYIKNIGIDIPYQLAFGWEMKDIQVDGNVQNDYIKINGTQYFLNQPLDKTYTGLSDSKFYLVDDTNSSMGGKVLYLDWSSSLTYLVQVESRSGQYNAPVTLFVKVGTLTSGQEKYTTMYWWDSNEDLTTFTESDAGGYYSETTTTCTFTNLPLNANNEYVYKDYGVGYFSGTYSFSFEGKITAEQSAGADNGGAIWMLSNTLDDIVGQGGLPHYSLTFYRQQSPAGRFILFQNKTSALAFDIATSTSYYFSVSRNNTKVSLKTYSDSARTTLLSTLILGTDASEKFRYLFCGASYNAPGSVAIMSGYVKYLNITALPSPGFNVTTLPATNTKATNSTLNGNVNWTNTEWFQYGLTTAYGTTTASQSIKNGSFNQNIKGLTPGKLYHYRAVANNGTSTIYGVDKIFLTKPEAPTNFKARYVTANTINLSWTKGTGANNTRIQRSTIAQPKNISDGTNVYNGTGSSYVNTVSTDTDHYYTAWSFSKGIYNTTTYYQFSDNNTKCFSIRTINATGVEETNATLRGFLTNDGGENISTLMENYTTKDRKSVV